MEPDCYLQEHSLGAGTVSQSLRAQTDRQTKKKHMHTRNFRTPCHFAFTALAYRVIASSANSNSVLMCWPCLKCPCATSIQNQVEELTSVVSDSPLLFIQLSVAVPRREWLLCGRENQHVLFSNYCFEGEATMWCHFSFGFVTAKDSIVPLKSPSR